MKLSWKDIITTMVAIVVAIALIAKLRNYDWAFIGSWQGAVGTLGVLGALMLIFSESDFTKFNTWTAVEGLIALAGIGLFIAGLIVDSKTLFVLMAVDILVLWLTSLARHTFSHEMQAGQERTAFS